MKLKRGRVVLMPSAVQNTMTQCSNVDTLQHQSTESSYKHRTHYIKAPSCCCFSFFSFTLFSSSSQHSPHTARYFLTSIFPPSPDCDYSYIFCVFLKIALRNEKKGTQWWRWSFQVAPGITFYLMSPVCASYSYWIFFLETLSTFSSNLLL